MLNTAPKNLKQKAKKVFLVLLALYLVIGLVLFVFQENFLFRPVELPQDHVFKLQYDFDEHFLETNDNAKINVLHIKPKDPRGAILYFHGNAGNLERWSKITEYFAGLNYDIYIMDYRTYGKSTGKLSEEVLYNDAELCYQYLRQFWDEEHITVYGRSLGTAMASRVAATHNPKQLILEAPFYDIADVAQRRFPIYPINYLLKYELSNFKHLQRVKCPVTIIHGTKDYVVPFNSGEKLYKSSSKEKTSFTIIEGGGHNNLIKFDSYHRLIGEILR